MLQSARLPLFNSSGTALAWLEITPVGEQLGKQSDPLVLVDIGLANEYGETELQLKEAELYEYQLTDTTCEYRLRSSLSNRRKNLRPGDLDAGRIDTKNYCGTLRLELTKEVGDQSTEAPLAVALVDIRSLKVDYRTEYRGMLRDLAQRLESLVVEAQSSATIQFRSTFEERSDLGWIQLQLELLRDTLDGTDFDAALSRVLAFPHERLAPKTIQISSDKPTRLGSQELRQLIQSPKRKAVPTGHPLVVNHGIRSVAEKISVSRKFRDLDTPENRFVKYALQDLRSFLSFAQTVFQRHTSHLASATLSGRLINKLDDWLARSFFQETGPMSLPTLGSPVLQRKSGYREVFRMWLQFRGSAELSWEGGDDVFRAGQRDVASLYEYWLFFVLLDWFCDKCRADKSRPDISELVDGLAEGAPSLSLKKRSHLGPFTGKFSRMNRVLCAEFDYNRVFSPDASSTRSESWTRRLHPDYTFTFWPAEFNKKEAEEAELLVRIHFDAKYRVEDIEKLFGAEGSLEAGDVEDSAGNYKHQDLLKMHAYRDAIRRSQGAYVLYPGHGGQRIFQMYHEILPGLGAFAISPNAEGKAQGLPALEEFLDRVLLHLSDRTTAQERVSYHVQETYRRGTVREPRREYGALSERDIVHNGFRAIPPAEEMVLAAWYNTEAQLSLAQLADGIVFVRLGMRQGSLRVHPNFARVRHVVLRAAGGKIAPGLLEIREDGYRIFNREDLRKLFRQRKSLGRVSNWEAIESAIDENYYYAVFDVRPDESFDGWRWNGNLLMDKIELFETDRRNRVVTNLARSSPFPRLLPFQLLLNCRQQS
jgi:predicted component of viral defense system (DUF524 family)